MQPSLNLSPCDWVSFYLSEPAKSTKWNIELTQECYASQRSLKARISEGFMTGSSKMASKLDSFLSA